MRDLICDTVRLVSHPEIITLVIETLRDCGAVVTLGDEGSKKLRKECLPTDNRWIHDLAKATRAKLVSYAKTGARETRSGLHFPRSYLISRAVLEADHVVNCAKFQPHSVLGMSGAVKNMFNAVVGQRQQNLHELFTSPMDLARIVVDVCSVVRPTISFLDLTTVRDTEGDGSMQPVGLLLAGCDPVALDAVAAHAVGWNGDAIPTLSCAENDGSGCADLNRITLSGIDWAELGRIRVAKVPQKLRTLSGSTPRLAGSSTRRSAP